MAREPAAVDTWLADPRAAPHGGESLLAFISRIGGWLDTRPAEDVAAIVAVAEPAVVRAALVYALKAPPADVLERRCPPTVDDHPDGPPGRWNLCLDAGAWSGPAAA